ncbi:MAG: SOS response-associated peptidase [Balneolaceae bacterium]|nr:SOS response-associated peptidase [Balneolaceae bacterium]
MSDRFVLHAEKKAVEELLGATASRDDWFEANYNINVGTHHPILIVEEGERVIQQALWGLIPKDAGSEREGREHHQMHLEEMKEAKKSGVWAELGCCIIPANGFYKWKFSEKRTTPFYIRLLSNQVMGIAGLYSVWQSDSGRDVYSFLMLQTEANALVKPVSDHMPLILDRDDFGRWLEDGAGDLDDLLKPYDLSRMAVNRVTEDVNDLDKNSPELIQPIPK